jgi:hypothetical protein
MKPISALARTASVAALCLAAAAPLRAVCDWPQFSLNPQHDGNNTNEIFLSSANISNITRIFQVTLRGTADGAPAFLSHVSTAGGLKDLVFVTTKNGYIQALDAHSGAEVWFARAASGPQYTTSSPAVDPSRLYVYSYGLDGSVHKYQVSDGTEITTGGWPELATLKPTVEKGSAALSFATDAAGTTYLYCSNGGYPGDAGDYQGHVTAINLTDGTQHVFNASCSDSTVHFVLNGNPPSDCPAHPQNAVWARPGVVYDAATDLIYFATSNGDYDADGHAPPDTHDWGDSVLCIHPDGTGVNGGPLDSYTPLNYQQLEDQDLDLGSTSPVLLPMPNGSVFPHVAAQAGKEGVIVLINLDDMSGQGGPGHTGGEMQMINVPQGGSVLPTPAVWVNPADGSTWMFLSDYNGIAGLKITLTAGTPQLSPQWHINMGSVSSPVVANNVLYYVTGNLLSAADPTTGTTLGSSTQIGGVHWESPIVINGTVYITDESSHLSTFTVHGGFSDVPVSNPFHNAVDSIARDGITAGCGGTLFCPGNPVLRSQMAVFLLKGEHGSCYVPPPATGTVFADVPANSFGAAYIEEAAAEGITGGCGGGNYCPSASIVRSQMAVFLLRAEHGSTYAPPACTPPGQFTDVPCPGGGFTNWIYQLVAEGVTAGCTATQYCPTQAVSRAQMAVFLVATFRLP